MSALAKLSLSKGISVSGSDSIQSETTDELTHLGVKIFIGHKKRNVQKPDLLVYTCAVGERNVELLEAKKQNIPIMERSDFLGEISKQYKTVIAVSGSHGKTTVCAQIGYIFQKAGKKPTILVGGECDFGNLLIGDTDYLVVEACEYKKHFLKIKHDLAIVLNIDYDHPDFFKSPTQYANAFAEFASQTTNCNVIDEKYKILVGDSNAVTYGTGGNYVAKHIRHYTNKTTFDVYKNNKFLIHIQTKLLGDYNILNTICSVAMCDICKIDLKTIQIALKEYGGVKRRYEFVGKINKCIVVSDYAHHPTQVANCINSTSKLSKGKITVVFEPHTYTRTKKLFGAFIDALSIADNIILLPTYSAREKPIKGGRSKDLFNALVFKLHNVEYINSYAKCIKRLNEIKEGIILLLGAGTIGNMAKKIKQNYVNKNQIAKNSWL